MANPESTPPELATPPTAAPLAQLTNPANLTSAAKWGAIVGVGYFIVAFGLDRLGNALAGLGPSSATNPSLLVPACLAIALPVFAIYIAGYMPGLECGQVVPGVLSAAIMIAVADLLQAIFRVGSQSATPAPSLGLRVVSLIFVLALALGLGCLGAFYGVKRGARNVAKRAPRD